MWRQESRHTALVTPDGAGTVPGGRWTMASHQVAPVAQPFPPWWSVRSPKKVLACVSCPGAQPGHGAGLAAGFLGLWIWSKGAGETLQSDLAPRHTQVWGNT